MRVIINVNVIVFFYEERGQLNIFSEFQKEISLVMRVGFQMNL